MFGLILLANSMQKSFVSVSEFETGQIAQKIASVARKGDVFALYGTLGMGKSVFARAFIQFLTEAKEVPSPTFTLVQDYSSDKFEIYHFDLYRLKSPDEVFELGFEEAVYGGVSLIEWPEKAGAWLPKNIFRIDFSTQGENRLITVTAFSDEKAERLEQLK